MKILHIAAHMGGGIGSAYVGLGTCGQEQTILLLEPPQDYAALARVKAAGFRVLQIADHPAVEQELRRADVVVFSWYHHPALTKLLHDFPAIPIRSILWCHISGNYFPHIPAEFVTKFDQCMFTTPHSLELPQIRAFGSVYAKEHFQVIYGLNDLGRFFDIRRERHDLFRIGYVGTLGFCKLHPDFVDYCAAVNLPEVRFTMVGNPSTKAKLLAAAKGWEIDGQFEFCGQMDDIRPALGRMDVFSYLLNPQHFGTTENALLEAMAAGLPVIALDQCVERHIVRDGVTGFLVHSPEEYGEAVRLLYGNPDKAREMGMRAQADVLARYDLRKNREHFVAACGRAVTAEKAIHRFDDLFIGEPADWFLSCVEADKRCFLENRVQEAGLIFHERTKGSPIHYHSYFPGDERLSRWAEQIMAWRSPGRRL